MINNYLQLSSWIISILLGFIYYYFINVIVTKLNSHNIIIKIFIDTLYILIISLLLIYIYYKFNGGYIHYGYPLFYTLGYIAAKIVNKSVNMLKKTFFLKKR